MDQVLGMVDSSFKYILIGFNLLTLLVVYLHQRGKKTIKQHHILFVTAHTDDEAMFFGPTITSLVNDYYIHLLCLSKSNDTREAQLAQSVKYLGIHKYKCIHDQNLIDGKKEKWNEQTILKEVSTYVTNNQIKAIFTFDSYGISGHPNHQSIYNALSSCETTEKPSQKQTTIQKKDEEESVDVPDLKKIYYLQSSNIIRKYSGILQILIALLRDFCWFRLNYVAAWRSMQNYKSQFHWYRKLWIIISKYAYINTYTMRKIALPSFD